MKNSTRCVVCATIAFVCETCLFAEEPAAKKSDSEMKKNTDVSSSDLLRPTTAPQTPDVLPAASPPSLSTQRNANLLTSPTSNVVGPSVNPYGAVPTIRAEQRPTYSANSPTYPANSTYGYSIGPIQPPGPSQPFNGISVTNSTNNRPMSPEETERTKAFLEAVNQLRNQKTEEDKESVREKLTKLVSEQLDADLTKREEELAAIEKRTQQLRAQLEERKAAKPEMLKMLVMLIDNPQMGVGIPAEWMQTLMGVSSYSEYSRSGAIQGR